MRIGSTGYRACFANACWDLRLGFSFVWCGDRCGPRCHPHSEDSAAHICAIAAAGLPDSSLLVQVVKGGCCVGIGQRQEMAVGPKGRRSVFVTETVLGLKDVAAGNQRRRDGMPQPVEGDVGVAGIHA